MIRILMTLMLCLIVTAAANAGESHVLKWGKITQYSGYVFFKWHTHCYRISKAKLNNLEPIWRSFATATAEASTSDFDDNWKPCYFEQVWVVASGRYSTRPVKSQESDKEIGRASVGMLCGDYVRRSTRTRNYREFELESGDVGYTLCAVDWRYQLSGSIN